MNSNMLIITLNGNWLNLLVKRLRWWKISFFFGLCALFKLHYTFGNIINIPRGLSLPSLTLLEENLFWLPPEIWKNSCFSHPSHSYLDCSPLDKTFLVLMSRPKYHLLLETFSDQLMNLSRQPLQWAAITLWQGLSELLSPHVVACFLVYIFK